MQLIKINEAIAKLNPEEIQKISDGYHTFEELYQFRLLYNAFLFNLMHELDFGSVHKSRYHHDGVECFDGTWFIVMAQLPTGQISNHYKLDYWNLFEVTERDRADEWDGHTSQDVADRIMEFLQNCYLEVLEPCRYSLHSRLSPFSSV